MKLRFCQSLFFGASVAGVFVAGAVQTVQAHPATDIVAKNWSFTPSAVEVHVGEETVFNLTSAEGVHGIESSDLGISATMITPGKTVSVKFTPKTVGTYTVHCSVVCGAGHEKMALTVTVVP